MTEIYKYIFSILFILIIVLIIFYKPILKDTGTVQWDAKEVHLYNLIFSSKFWHENNVLPTWNQYIFNGFPQIADPQVAIFYPINFLIVLLTIFSPKILMCQIALHYFLAGMFMFFLARYLTKNYLIGCFAAVAYMFSGFMIGHASHIGMQNTATWLPLLLLLLLLLFEKRKILFSASFGFFLAIAFLAGHFQTFLYVFFFLLLVFIYKVFQNKELIKIKNFKFVIIICAIFLFVISIQLLPTYQLTKESFRSELSLELSQTESLKPSSLLSFLYPNYNNVVRGGYKGPWDRTQNYLFIGFSTLILSIIGIVFSKKKLKFFLLLVVVIALTYSFGKYFFVQPIFYKLLPLFDKIRAPSNMMLLVEFSLILLAVLGLDFLKNKAKRGKKYSYIIIFFLIIISIEVVFLTSLNTLLYERVHPSSAIMAPNIAGTILYDYQSLDKNYYFNVYRINEIGIDRNFLQIFDIYSADGYNPLTLKRQGEYENIMVENPKLIDLAGIKYLPCKYIAGRNGLEKIRNICINEKYYPSIFFIEDYILAKDEREALNLLPGIDFKKYVLLEERPENFNQLNTNDKNKPKIDIIESKPGFWKIKINSKQKGFLVIRETFYPGWKATINGLDSKIYRANYIFKAVIINPGENLLILEFKPKILLIGIGLTTLGIILTIVLLIGSILYEKKSTP